ncbi:MAG: folate family ECF transporter S component [Clostridia bacterium]|nr:folate family ECF transporter S component [Clostridia bacterium]
MNENAFKFSYIFKTVVSRWYYYVALAVFLILLFCFFLIKKQPERNNLSKTQKLVYASLLSAVCAVLNVFDIPVNDMLQLSFVATIGFISGYLLGGGYGFAVCFIGDLLGAIINPHGPYNPIIGIGTGCWGLIFGLAFSFFKGKDIFKCAISYLLGFILISAGINTFGFCVMYPTMYTLELLLPLLPFKLLTVVANFVLSVILIKLLPKVLPKEKFNL